MAALDKVTQICFEVRSLGAGRRKAELPMLSVTIFVLMCLAPEPQESPVQLPNCFMLQKVGCPLNKEKTLVLPASSSNCDSFL